MKIKCFLLTCFLLLAYTVVKADNHNADIAQTSPFDILKSIEIVNKNYSDSIPFVLNKDEIIIEVIINRKIKHFMFDSYGVISLSAELWKELNVQPLNAIQANDSQGNLMTQEVGMIQNLSIGNLSYINIGVMLLDINNIPGMNCYGIDGVIGPCIMRNSVWTIDYQRKMIYISDNVQRCNLATNAVNVPMQKSSLLQPAFNLQTNSNNGKSLLIHLDTGSNSSISLNYSEFYCTRDSLPGEILFYEYGASGTGGGGYGKNDTTYHAVFAQLAIGKLKLDKYVASLKEQGSQLVGNKFLQNFIVTMDYINDRIVFIPVANKSSNTFEIYPVNFVLRDNKIKVGSVIAAQGKKLPAIGIENRVVSINNHLIPSEATNADFCHYIFNGSYKHDKKLRIEVIDNQGNLKTHTYKKLSKPIKRNR